MRSAEEISRNAASVDLFCPKQKQTTIQTELHRLWIALPRRGNDVIYVEWDAKLYSASHSPIAVNSQGSYVYLCVRLLV